MPTAATSPCATGSMLQAGTAVTMDRTAVWLRTMTQTGGPRLTDIRYGFARQEILHTAAQAWCTVAGAGRSCGVSPVAICFCPGVLCGPVFSLSRGYPRQPHLLRPVLTCPVLVKSAARHVHGTARAIMDSERTGLMEHGKTVTAPVAGAGETVSVRRVSFRVIPH